LPGHLSSLGKLKVSFRPELRKLTFDIISSSPEQGLLDLALDTRPLNMTEKRLLSDPPKPDVDGNMKNARMLAGCALKICGKPPEVCRHGRWYLVTFIGCEGDVQHVEVAAYSEWWAQDRVLAEIDETIVVLDVEPMFEVES
jgi:hypothetical protein